MAESNILKRSRSLRKASKSLSIDELAGLILQIESLIAERKEEQELELKLDAEKLKAVELIKKQMEAANIDISDIDGTAGNRKPKLKKRMPFKYQIEGPDGKITQYSGMGRKPNIIIKYLKKKGNELDDLLISKK